MPFSELNQSFFKEYQKALFITNEDGDLLFINPAFSQLTGYNLDNIGSERLTESLSNLSHENPALAQWETVLTKKDGSKLAVKVQFSLFKLDTSSTAKVYTLEDNTLLNEYRNENSLLSKKVEQLNEELERFTYITSHDLQAPLRMVASYIQLIQKSLDKNEGERAREFMTYVQDGVSNLHSLIDGLLQFSRINRKGNTRIELDTNEVVRASVAQLSEKIQKASAKLIISKLPVITGDQSQLRQLFLNLIDNALKFKAPNRELVVNISVEEADNEYRFSVTDNGIGIESKYHDRIFQIFQKLHSRADYEGTGAGLAICKKIVENHGGRIWVESDFDSGATFFFTLKK